MLSQPRTQVLSWLEVEADSSGTAVGEPYDAGCDVWSVGVTAHVLLCAELPFELPEECSEAAIVAAARNATLSFTRQEWHGDAMADARGFVRACMVATRAERATATALLDHAWVATKQEPAAGPTGVNAAFVEMLNETAALEVSNVDVMAASANAKSAPSTARSAASAAHDA